MFAATRITTPSFIVLVVGLVATITSPPRVEAGGAAGPQIMRMENLTKQQLDLKLKRLPDNAVIESQGQRMTKAQIRALAAQKGQQHHAKARAATNQANAAFDERRVQIERQEQTDLQAGLAKAMVEFGRQAQAGPPGSSAQLEAIQQEAAQLFQRSKTASVTEQARIEQRAGELLQQLQQIGR